MPALSTSTGVQHCWICSTCPVPQCSRPCCPQWHHDDNYWLLTTGAIPAKLRTSNLINQLILWRRIASHVQRADGNCFEKADTHAQATIELTWSTGESLLLLAHCTRAFGLPLRVRISPQEAEIKLVASTARLIFAAVLPAHTKVAADPGSTPQGFCVVL